MTQQAVLLVFAVIAVGVFHTLVPDHWLPITVLARQRGWSRMQTARAAFGAGVGHALSTLVIGAIVWIAGLAVAVRFGHLVSLISSFALIGFGGWIAVTAFRELHDGHGHHDGSGHQEEGKPGSRTALLLILGSSPMVEGIPAFFAAARFGWATIVIMSALFAISTIATYVGVCALSAKAFQRFSFGPLERYGEVLSGSVIALVGIVFLIWPIA